MSGAPVTIIYTLQWTWKENQAWKPREKKRGAYTEPGNQATQFHMFRCEEM